MHTSHSARGALLVLGAAALWGTTGTAQSFSSGALSAAWFGALRLALAALFFAALACAMHSRGSAGASRRLPLGVLFGAGACMAVYNLAFFAGLRVTGVALGTAIALGSGPVWAGVLQALLLRRAPSRAWWAGTALAAFGAAALALGRREAIGDIGGAGIASCLLAGLAYAGYTLISKRLVGVAPPQVITLHAFGAAALIALPLAWLDGGAPAWRAADLLPLLYVGIATSGLAYLLFNHALRHVSAATAVALALAEPVVACLLAVSVIGEPVGATAWVGLASVVCGVLVVVRAEATPRANERGMSLRRTGMA